MAKITRDLDNNNPVLTIDLSETLGVESVPDSTASAIGQSIIDLIRDRTQNDNVNKNGTDFKGYSSEYVNSNEFEAFGKSESDVNLTATGDMLGLMDIIDFDGQTLKIGWNDPDQAAKAHGHITGKNGEVPKMKRDFFGLSIDELENIVEPLRDEIEEPEIQLQAERDVVQEILTELQAPNTLRSIFDEGDDG